MYSIKKIQEGVWAIEENFVRAFLIVGTAKTLLFDGCLSETNILSEARSLTTLPVAVAVSHNHDDHIGGFKGYTGVIYAHPFDIPKLEKDCPKANFSPVEDGYEFDLGGRVLTVIHCPGHTRGSIALYEKETGTIFSGDNIADSTVYMFGGEIERKNYLETLKMLDLMDIKTIYPCHGSCPIDRGMITELILGMEEIVSGRLTGTKFDGLEKGSCMKATLGRASFYLF